jgi:hypothetical protein
MTAPMGHRARIDGLRSPRQQTRRDGAESAQYPPPGCTAAETFGEAIECLPVHTKSVLQNPLIGGMDECDNAPPPKAVLLQIHEPGIRHQ